MNYKSASKRGTHDCVRHDDLEARHFFRSPSIEYAVPAMKSYFPKSVGAPGAAKVYECDLLHDACAACAAITAMPGSRHESAPPLWSTSPPRPGRAPLRL